MLLGDAQSFQWTTTSDLNAAEPPDASATVNQFYSVVGVAVDLDAGTVTFYRRTGETTSEVISVLGGTGLDSGTWFPFVDQKQGTNTIDGGASVALVTQEPSMFITVPAGYSPWDDNVPTVSQFWTGFVQAVES